MIPRSVIHFAAALALFAGLAPRTWAGDEDGLPVVKVFEESGAQSKGTVLAFARARDGTLFVGSNQLSAFDGSAWERIPLPHAYAIRALAAEPANRDAPDRVWIGATGAIGYLERTIFGNWSFTSLQGELAATGLTNLGDIWFAQAASGGAVFVASHHVLRWDGARLEVWPLASVEHLTGFAGRNGRVWIYQPGVGLLRFDEGAAPVLVRPTRDLPPATVVWAGEAGGDASTLLVVTNEGLCRVSDRGCEELPDASAVIRGNFPVTASQLDAGTLAIATVEAGVVIANSTTGEVGPVLNAATGLATDNVHALWSDAVGTLWVGLDNGFARVDAVNALSLYDRRMGMGPGTPQKVVEHAGRRYVLTDRELFIVAGRGSPAAETAPLVPLVQRQPLLHDVLSAHGRLWLAGYGAIWLVRPSGAVKVVSDPTEIDHLCALENPAGGVAFTEGRTVRCLTPKGEDWAVSNISEPVADAPLSLLADADGDLWVSTVLAGIYRYRRSETAGAPWTQVGRYQDGVGLPRGTARSSLTLTGRKVVAFTDAAILEFNDAAAAFEPLEGFHDFQGLAAANAGDAAYWLVKQRRVGEEAPPAVIVVKVDPSTGRLGWEPLRTPAIETVGEIGRFDVTGGANHRIAWFTGGHGILRLNLQNVERALAPPSLILRHLSVGSTPFPLNSAPATFGPGLPRIDFRLGVVNAWLDEPVYFETRLGGVEASWSAPERTPEREFTGLAHGWYTFQARAVDRFGRAGPPAGFAFRVLAPWYVRPLAVGADLAAAALVIYGFVRLRLRRLHRQTEKLNQLVADRTRHLELVSTAKSEFLENISHEIRNPLNGIVGLSHMFHEDRLSPPDRELARSLKASAEHLRRVSEEVLSFSALEYGQLSVEEKAFTLASLLEGIVDLYRVSAQQRGNKLGLAVATELTRSVIGDANKIETIIGNFVSNAIKYAPGGPVEIRAECELTPGGVQAVISVADHGAGIPPLEQELIFQKFVRGTNAKAARVPGTGIGLAACRVLARALGGSVGVDSEPGSGATFHLWLPLKWATTQPASPPRGGSALIVEDEEYNRVVLRGTAEALGYRASGVANAADAISLLDQTAFDLLMLDWELPGTMKGPDLARLVRSRPGGERPVILAVTAHNSDDVRRRAREAGMDAFLLKPVDNAQVGTVIASVLARRNAPVLASEELAEATTAAAVAGETESPGAVSSDDPPLNLGVFRTFAQYAPEHAHDPAGHFLVSVQAEVSVIEAACERQDWPAVASAAHRLRALAALVRAARLNRASSRLQDAAKAGTDVDVINTLVGETVAAAADLKAQISFGAAGSGAP